MGFLSSDERSSTCRAVWRHAISYFHQRGFRHLCPVPTFAAESDVAGLPVDVIEGHNDVAELLLANQAEANAKNNYSETPLHLVVRRGRGANHLRESAGRKDVA